MKKRPEFVDVQSDGWIDDELARCEFHDAHHARRLGKLLEQFADDIGVVFRGRVRIGQTPRRPTFFSNPRISEGQILGGHLQATGERIRAYGAWILMLHDTTEFTFHRKDAAPVGMLNKSYMRKNKGVEEVGIGAGSSALGSSSAAIRFQLFQSQLQLVDLPL